MLTVSGVRGVEPQTGRQGGGGDRIALVECDRGTTAGVLHHRPVDRRFVVVLEDAVTHQFRIQTAVIGVVDFLGHQAVQGRADRHAWLGQVDRDDGLRRRQWGDQEGQRKQACAEQAAVWSMRERGAW
jgi:hypothetical protein